MAIATPVNVDTLDIRAPVGRFDLARDEVGATPALDLPFVERHFGRDILRRAKAEGLRRERSRQPRREWEAEQEWLRTEASALQTIGNAIGAWIRHRRTAVLAAERVAALDAAAVPSDRGDPVLEQVAITVPMLTVLPLSGNAVIRHLRDKLEEVGTRFLPCVDFLVHCQLEVRQGLELAQRGQLTPSQFLAATVTTLPEQFEQRSAGRMPLSHLEAALVGLVGLVKDAKATTPHG